MYQTTKNAPSVRLRTRLTAFLLALLFVCGAWTVRAKAADIDYSPCPR